MLIWLNLRSHTGGREWVKYLCKVGSKVILMLPILQMQIGTVLNSLSPSNIASKCSFKLFYGQISFIVLVPGLQFS